MNEQEFLSNLAQEPSSVQFEECIAVIDAHYDFSETAFKNGDLTNSAGQNNGSCKILAFAQINSLSPEQTLQCFGKYYRDDVLGHPDAEDHQNIRNFIEHGWQGVQFDSEALSPKAK